MRNFFRKNRQQLLTENKFSKYLLYAIGEIVLVVIGILIALQINMWNQSEKLSKKELSLLFNLKNDVDSDILSLKAHDSFYAKLQPKSEIAIKLFYEARTIKDFDTIISLNNFAIWNELYINQNTYKEMINSGSMYTMKNKELQNIIIKYYLNAEADRIYLRDVNKVQSQLSELTPDIFPYKFLIYQLQTPQIDLNLIDTTWINNLKSPTYLAVTNWLQSNLEENNIYRRSVYRRNLKTANELAIAISEELESNGVDIPPM